jgi:hypothetical protein
VEDVLFVSGCVVFLVDCQMISNFKGNFLRKLTSNDVDLVLDDSRWGTDILHRPCLQTGPQVTRYVIHLLTQHTHWRVSKRHDGPTGKGTSLAQYRLLQWLFVIGLNLYQTTLLAVTSPALILASEKTANAYAVLLFPWYDRVVWLVSVTPIYYMDHHVDVLFF